LGSSIFVAELSDLSKASRLTHDDDGLWDNENPAWSPDGTYIPHIARAISTEFIS
jgi:Tol biopolymer transport system component